ncbi:carboxypeptidase regulatory-like domain-containing protein, partial [Candidatus Bathyarchaeota archaeon]|nr:carboxypeptidase regulatory-like domain-containing protein [Candidatus Bathyarchaeota archaeon]
MVTAGVRLVSSQTMGTINGRIIDLNTGLGITGATVSASGPSQQVNTTDSNGYYTISGMAPGPYVFVASASGYLSQTYKLFVRETANPPFPDFRLHLLSIIGRVYDLSTPSIGIAEANVTISGHIVFTNSTGYYEMLDLSDGSYAVAATAPGYTNETQQVTVSTGISAVADFGLTQVASGTISGTVTDSSTRQALYQATVRVSRESFEKLGITDQNGQYMIENVRAWPFWTIDAYKTGYIAQSTTTEVQPGGASTLDFELTPFGTINGTVKDQATDLPISGALIKADSAFLGTTDSNGHYAMFALVGRYTVTASAPGYASESQSNVRVTEGDTTTLNFALTTIPPGSIIGNVTDTETGSGIAGATVTVNGHTNITDANGDYVLSNLPSWTYNVTASVAGYGSDTTVRTVPSGGSITANFALPPYTRVHLGPYSNTGNAGESFNLNINLSEARSVDGWEVYLWWNPAILEVADMVEGDFLKGPFGNRTTELSFETYPNEGVVHIEEWSTLGTPDEGVDGNGTLATIVFQIKAKGVS